MEKAVDNLKPGNIILFRYENFRGRILERMGVINYTFDRVHEDGSEQLWVRLQDVKSLRPMEFPVDAIAIMKVVVR